MQAKARFTGGLSFEASFDTTDTKVVMDALPEAGSRGLGPSPKQVLLSAILGCSGMDTAALLKKFRVPFESLELTAEAQTTETHPKVFTQVDVVFSLKSGPGQVLDQGLIHRAVEMSLTKYCGVSAMVSKVSPIFYTVMVNSEITLRGQAKFWP